MSGVNSGFGIFGICFLFLFFFFPREISEDSEYINSTSGGLDWACHVSAT